MKGDLSFGADEGAARVVGGGTGSDGLARAGGGVDCCWCGGGLLVGCQLLTGLLGGEGGEGCANSGDQGDQRDARGYAVEEVHCAIRLRFHSFC